MAPNNQPIFTEVPLLGMGIWTSSLTANVKSDGTGTIGTDMVKLLTAGADGTFINKVRLSPCASAAATATTATMARLYLSTVGSGSTTRADTLLFAEIACPAQTADQTTTATNCLEVPVGLYIPTGYFMHFSMHHAAAANTSWAFLAFAGSY